MKNILLFTLIVITISKSFSQRMITRTGEIKFEASMPAIEEVTAVNKTVSCIFDKTSGDFVALALIKSFKFQIPLMEEHFNENYIESTKYPKATFKGKIINFDASKISTTKTNYDLEGDLTMHGITKKIKTKITIYLNDDKLITTSNFNIKPQDYGIEIPNIVKNKISENVRVNLNFILANK